MREHSTRHKKRQASNKIRSAMLRQPNAEVRRHSTLAPAEAAFAADRSSSARSAFAAIVTAFCCRTCSALAPKHMLFLVVDLQHA